MDVFTRAVQVTMSCQYKIKHRLHLVTKMLSIRNILYVCTQYYASFYNLVDSHPVLWTQVIDDVSSIVWDRASSMSSNVPRQM